MKNSRTRSTATGPALTITAGSATAAASGRSISTRPAGVADASASLIPTSRPFPDQLLEALVVARQRCASAKSFTTASLAPANRTSIRPRLDRHALGQAREPRLERLDGHRDPDPGEPRLAELRHHACAGKLLGVSPARTAQLMRTFGAEPVRDVCRRGPR